MVFYFEKSRKLKRSLVEICEAFAYMFEHKDAYEIKSKYLNWESIYHLYRELYQMKSKGANEELYLDLEDQKTLQNLARNIVFAWFFVLSSPIKLIDKNNLSAKKYLKVVLKESNYLFNQSSSKGTKSRKERQEEKKAQRVERKKQKEEKRGKKKEETVKVKENKKLKREERMKKAA